MQRWIKEEKGLEQAGKVQRGSKGFLTPFHRVSQSLAAKNRVYELLQEVCRGSTGCFRISTGCSVIPTGCSTIGFLGDG